MTWIPIEKCKASDRSGRISVSLQKKRGGARVCVFVPAAVCAAVGWSAGMTVAAERGVGDDAGWLRLQPDPDGYTLRPFASRTERLVLNLPGWTGLPLESRRAVVVTHESFGVGAGVLVRLPAWGRPPDRQFEDAPAALKEVS